MPVKKSAINAQERLMYSDEFTDETTEEDGIYLYTIDRATHDVVGYYIAFDGYWCAFKRG